MVRKVLAAVLMICVVCGAVLADVPQLLNYQGKLTDGDGAPIEGGVTVGFGFYDTREPAAGQKPLYYEEQSVDVENGIFHVLIGHGSNQQGLFSNIYAGDNVYLEITVDPGGAAQVMAPRQRIGSVVFALKAGTADGLAELTATVATLQAQMAELQDRLQHVSRDGDRIIITGANLQIVNGEGVTHETNSFGNLIVGYNEAPPGGRPIRWGSHNIIVGKQHSYGSYGGLVAGFYNSIMGSHATVTGGYRNAANGDYASVSGGEMNDASGNYSSVTGGASNTASSYYASVGGGKDNNASGNYASVSGGQYNKASGQYS